MTVYRGHLEELTEALGEFITHSGSTLQEYDKDAIKVGSVISYNDSKYFVVNVSVNIKGYVKVWGIKINKDGDPLESTVGFMSQIQDITLIANTLEEYDVHGFTEIDAIKALNLLKDGEKVYIEDYEGDKVVIDEYDDLDDYGINDFDDLLTTTFYIKK